MHEEKSEKQCEVCFKHLGNEGYTVVREITKGLAPVKKEFTVCNSICLKILGDKEQASLMDEASYSLEQICRFNHIHDTKEHALACTGNFFVVRAKLYSPASTHQWISVTEKLPAESHAVLVTNGSEIYVAWIESFNKERPIWQYSYCCGCLCDNIKYWQELPSMPEEN